MTGAEMITNWKIGFDIISSSAAPGFTDTEIYSLLNKAEDYLVLESYKNKQWENIHTIIRNYYTVPVGSTGGYSVALPSSYYLGIDSASFINRIAIPSTGFISTSTITNKVIDNIDLKNKNTFLFYKDAFNAGKIYKNPYVYIEGGVINIICDLYTTIVGVSIHYIMDRVLISSSSSSQLPKVMHRIIVDQAIKFAQESIFSQLPNKQ